MPKCLTTAKLRRIVAESERKGFNQGIDRRAFGDRVSNGIDPDGVHVVTGSFVHGDIQCVRVQLLLKVKGTDEPREAVQDMTFEAFNAIPDVAIKDGQLIEAE